MTKSATSNTTSTEGLDRVMEIAKSMPRLDAEGRNPYPEGTVFISSDLPDFDKILRRSLLECEPVVVVYPDGRERYVESLSVDALKGRRRGPGRILRTLREMVPALGHRRARTAPHDD